MEPTTTTPNPAPETAAPAPAAAAPGAAPASTAAGAAVTPTLAQRYTYAQLDPAHKAIADQITALIIAYPDILAMRDPAAQRKFLEDVQKSGIGDAINNAGEGASGIAAAIRNSGVVGLSDVFKIGNSVSETAGNVGDAFGALGAGARLAFSPAAAAGVGSAEFLNQIKVIANGMTPQQAQDLATAYASTLQARQADRAGAGWTAPFAGFGHGNNFGEKAGNGFNTMFAYIGAAIAWVVDLVRGHVFNQDDVHTFQEHLQRAFFKGDMGAVRSEMARTPGLENGEAWGHVLTEGGTVQSRAGTDTRVEAPSVDNAAPSLPDAPADAAGAPVVEEANPAAVVTDATDKGLGAGKKELELSLQNAAKYMNNPVGWVALGLGGYGLIQTGRGMVEGAMRGGVKAKNDRANKAETRYNRAANKVTDLEEKLRLAENPEENNKRMFRVKETPEQLREQLESARAEADRLRGPALEARRAHRSAELRLNGGAMDELKGIGHAPRNLGRGLTLPFSGWFDHMASGVGDSIRNAPERWAAGVARAEAEISERGAKRDENKIRREVSRVEPGSDYPLETKYKDAQTETAARRAQTLEAKGNARGFVSGIAHRIAKTTLGFRDMFGGKAKDEPARVADAPEAPRPAPEPARAAPTPEPARPTPAADTARGPADDLAAPRAEAAPAKRGGLGGLFDRGAEMVRNLREGLRGGEMRGKPVELRGKAAATAAGVGAVILLTGNAASAEEAPRPPRRDVNALSNDELLAMLESTRPQAARAAGPMVRRSVVATTAVNDDDEGPIATARTAGQPTRRPALTLRPASA